MSCTLVTTTWNSVDHIAIFLAHYRKLGVDQLLVMDYESTDGTRDVLASSEWRGFVRQARFPGLELLDSSNLMLGIARSEAGPGDWCLFCDPDELLVTPSMRITDLSGAAESAGVESLSIPRFNVTGPRALVGQPDRISALDGLVLRIDRRAKRTGAAEIPKAVLEPPWIYTAIPGKILVRARSTVAIGEGDHSARTDRGLAASAPPGCYLLHYPFRGYEVFAEKVERARRGFEANPHLAEGHSWQYRRWIRLAQEGRLRAEYDEQFVRDEDLQRQLGDGTLIRDLSVARFHKTVQ